MQHTSSRRLQIIVISIIAVEIYKTTISLSCKRSHAVAQRPRRMREEAERQCKHMREMSNYACNNLVQHTSFRRLQKIKSSSETLNATSLQSRSTKHQFRFHASAPMLLHRGSEEC